MFSGSCIISNLHIIINLLTSAHLKAHSASHPPKYPPLDLSHHQNATSLWVMARLDITSRFAVGRCLCLRRRNHLCLPVYTLIIYFPLDGKYVQSKPTKHVTPFGTEQQLLTSRIRHLWTIQKSCYSFPIHHINGQTKKNNTYAITQMRCTKRNVTSLRMSDV